MKEIGGFFNLELDDKGRFLHDDGILFNSCRNALEYILLCIKPKLIWIPKYTCDSVLQPIEHLKQNYKLYSIDENLEIKDFVLGNNEVILYTNYFGIKGMYIKKLFKEFGNRLIVDNAQSLYSEPLQGIPTIYSPRKFVGVPDGGVAYIADSHDFDFKKNKSYERCRHLLRRYDESASESYLDFRNNDEALDNKEIQYMSELTKAILRGINFEKVKKKRMCNFMYLHKHLHKRNKLKINVDSIECPLVYPYYTNVKNLREILIENKIYVATYWPNVLNNCSEGNLEYDLAKKILPLPIDQRYDIKDMEYIINIIKTYGKI